MNMAVSGTGCAHSKTLHENTRKTAVGRRILLAAALLTLTTVTAHADLPSATAAAVNQALSSGKPTIIDLGSRNCAPCKQMAPILESLAKEYRGQANVLFINIDESETAAQKFRVQGIPTQVLFDTQGKEIDRHMGFLDKADLIEGLKRAGLK